MDDYASTSHQVNTIDALAAAAAAAERPIRAEVFGIERLQQHAESLAAAQPTADQPFKGRPLLPRVRENGRVLLAGYRNIVEAVRHKNQITQAEEWLLDNFHVVDAQMQEVRDHLPRSFYRLRSRDPPSSRAAGESPTTLGADHPGPPGSRSRR
ncbi:MAG: hypothetical protein AMS18_12395 [Gemmatimonas sp. SG8_17]|nr:MAG: hypothetical protein AMS18_12395 [Gemmatimonas sp. SG8_17]